MKLLTFISLAQARSRITPKETRNKAPTKISNEGLLKDVEQYSEDYMYERAQRLSCSKSGIEAALKRLHISQENTLEHPSNKKSWIYYEVMLFVLDTSSRISMAIYFITGVNTLYCQALKPSASLS